VERSWLFIMSVAGLLSSGIPASTLAQTSPPPKGVTGLTIGSYLTIEGTPEQSKFFNFKVDTVNGMRLKQPLFLEVDNVALTSQERYVLKGYESMRMIGLPPAINLARKEAGQPPMLERGAVWQVHYYFVALSVVSPKGVKLVPRD